jgi:hypothetical protein
MKQILLDQNSRTLFLEEVPIPKPNNSVVVQTNYGAISADTESSLITLAQKTKRLMAQKRPDPAGSMRDFRKINLVNSSEKYHKKSFFTKEKGIFNKLQDFVNNSPLDVKEMIDTCLIFNHARTSLETHKKIFLETM